MFAISNAPTGHSRPQPLIFIATTSSAENDVTSPTSSSRSVLDDKIPEMGLEPTHGRNLRRYYSPYEDVAAEIFIVRKQGRSSGHIPFVDVLDFDVLLDARQWTPKSRSWCGHVWTPSTPPFEQEVQGTCQRGHTLLFAYNSHMCALEFQTKV